MPDDGRHPTAAETGLLIVNADDWGGHKRATNAILQVYIAGAISSATAMVYMADTERSAGLAEEHSLPLGLHLNLTQPFDAVSVPAAVRERQRLACVALRPMSRVQRWTYDPRAATDRLIRACVEDQLEAFRTTFARDPTHIDSHNHVHGSPTVFLRLPGEFPVRRTDSLRGRLIAQRFVTTDRFYSISGVDRSFGARGIAETIEVLGDRSAEIMVHPAFDGEPEVLLGDEWLGAVREAHLADFSDLRRRKRSKD